MNTLILEAINYVFGREGTYSNDPNDLGGETVLGIARKKHPDLPIWKLVDTWDKKGPVPNEIYGYAVLFYEGWWNSCGARELTKIHKTLAMDIFDMSINCGKSAAIKTLQRSLNFLNRDQRDYPDIPVDGRFGSLTEGSLVGLLSAPRKRVDSIRLLYKEFNILRGAYYNELYASDQKKEKYIGWIDRCFSIPL